MCRSAATMEKQLSWFRAARGNPVNRFGAIIFTVLAARPSQLLVFTCARDDFSTTRILIIGSVWLTRTLLGTIGRMAAQSANAYSWAEDSRPTPKRLPLWVSSDL